jgi:hypothetical protein
LICAVTQSVMGNVRMDTTQRPIFIQVRGRL